MRQEPTGRVSHPWKTKHPQRQVNQMQAQINDAATTRLHGVIKPGFIGTIGVMEDQFHGIDLANLTRLNEPSHGLYAMHETVGQVYSEESIGCPGGVHDTAGLGSRAPQWFLAKHRQPGSQGLDRLLGMQRTRCGNHDTVQFLGQQRCHTWQHSSAWSQASGLLCERWHRIDNGDNLHKTATDQGLEAMLTNPPNTEETKTRPCHGYESKGLYRLQFVCVTHR
jgi:hypothetical protein